ncbi:hypothetical protein FH972_023862 [Carpinus fangiana]|uniref:Uncharacterized protein n=1 Tax=Carpinus fangiana TaxID=176857 RepID=A0A5N6KX23_9ROSI|nr:hypothetical protein FH972_023862 [Carpinus fangiana]
MEGSQKGETLMGAPGGEQSSLLQDDSGVIAVTMNEIPGYRVTRVLGTVYGLTVRSRNWGADIGSFFRSSVGGELKWLSELAYKSRNTAVERMISDCIGHGGNAIIALRFETTEVGMYIQASAYGTACIVEKVEEAVATAKNIKLVE